MNLDLSDEEITALTRLLIDTIDDDPVPLLAAHSDAKDDPRQDPAGTGARAIAAAEAIRAVTLYNGQEAAGGPPTVKSEPGPPMTLGNTAAARVRLHRAIARLAVSDRAQSRRDARVY